MNGTLPVLSNYYEVKFSNSRKLSSMIGAVQLASGYLVGKLISVI